MQSIIGRACKVWCMVHIHPHDKYFDRSLPFGLCSAPFGCCRWHGHCGIEFQLHYLDDFLFIIWWPEGVAHSLHCPGLPWSTYIRTQNRIILIDTGHSQLCFPRGKLKWLQGISLLMKFRVLFGSLVSHFMQPLSCVQARLFSLLYIQGILLTTLFTLLIRLILHILEWLVFPPPVSDVSGSFGCRSFSQSLGWC